MLAAVLENVPDEMRLLRRWNVWRYVRRHGKATKVPFDGVFANPGDTRDRAHWRSLDTACRCLTVGSRKSNEAGGLGFVFGPDDGLFGIDLDHCRDPQSGDIQPWAKEIIDACGSYTEVSPSQTGVKIFCQGKIESSCVSKFFDGHALPGQGKIEVYSAPRFFTVTGWRLSGCKSELRDCQDAIDSIIPRMAKPSRQASHSDAANATPAGPCPLSDDELIEKIFAGKNLELVENFSRLWRGDASEYQNDLSEADYWLCRRLAYWLGADEARIERLARKSGLARSKWDSPREDSTWLRVWAVRSALRDQKRFYQWPQPTAVKQDAPECPSSLLNQELNKELGQDCFLGNLTPTIREPKLDQRYSECRLRKLPMQSVNDPNRHRICGFACGSRNCYHCGAKWLDDNRQWFWGIIQQFTPLHCVTTTGPREDAAVRKQIDRARAADGSKALYVALPLQGDQVLWFVNAPIKESKEVTQEQAWKAFSYAMDDLRDLPGSKRIRSSHDLAITRSESRQKEKPTHEWMVLPQSGNLSDVEWKKIQKEAAEVDPRCVFSDFVETERCTLTLRCSEQQMYSLLERLIPSYSAPIIGSVRVRPGRTGTYVLRRPMEAERDTELCSF